MVSETSDKKVGSARKDTPEHGGGALSGDRPLSDPNDDRLGYAPFAKHLAKALREMMPVEGFVVSINGPWGSGKTTVLNFIEYYLKDVEEAKRPEVIYFNPWWFSGREDLTRRFFSEVSRAIDPRSEVLREIGQTLAHLGELVEKVPKPSGPFVSALSKVCGALARRLRKREPDLADLREKAEKLLRSQRQRFVVFVDDIDRLTVDEIRDVFKVIKAIANLPNMMYVLAFDRERVAEALKRFRSRFWERVP